MADADEVTRQQCHRGTPAPARRPFLQGRLRVGQPLLPHDFLGQQDNLTVEQQEPGQAVALNQPELLVQPLLNPVGHRAVAPLGGLQAEAPQVAGRGVAPGHGGIGQGVAQAGGQVEIALLRDSDRVGDGLRVLPEDFLHTGRGLQAEVVVGLDVGQCLLDGGVAPGRGEGVLQPAALRAVVVDVIGGRQGHSRAVGQRRQLPVAGGVAFEKILLQFHVHRIVIEPLPVGVEQPAGVLAPAFREQPGQRPVAASGEQ